MKIFGYEIKKIQPAKPLQIFNAVLLDENDKVINKFKVDGNLPNIDYPFVKTSEAIFLPDKVAIEQHGINYYKFIPSYVCYKKQK